MASGERRRDARQKRKQRSADRRRQIDARRAQMAARSEARNRAAREALEPLTEGERPGAVTAGAIVSAVIALIFWGSAGIAIFTDIEVSGEEPSIVYLVAVAILVSAMSWGMWRARYWAVLGFQAFMVLVMISAALGLVQATSLLQATGTTVVLVLAGVLFYFMVKALARIQMPDRLPRE